MGGAWAAGWTTPELLREAWPKAGIDCTPFDASAVRRDLLPAVASRPWGHVVGGVIEESPLSELPAARERMDRDEASAVLAYMQRGDGPAVVVALLAAAAGLVEDVRAAVAAVGVADGTESTRALRGKVLRRVSRVYLVSGVAPAGRVRADLVRDLVDDTVVELRFGALQLTDARFRREWRPYWERVRADHGAASAARLPPTELGLGVHDRPPFEGGRPRGDWQDGTDRSVLNRYRLHFRSNYRDRKKGEPPGGPPDMHVTRRFLHTGPELVAATTIARAAAPLGLARPGHRAAIRAVAAAVLRPRQTGVSDATLTTWVDGAPEPAAAADDAPDEALVGAVAHQLRARVGSGGPGGDRVRPIDRLEDDAVGRAAVRRVWHHLAQQETEWEVTATRAGIARAVEGAFSLSLTDASSPPSVEAPPADELAPTFPARLAALNAELGALPPEGSRRFVGLFLHDRPAWRELYRELFADRSDVLTVDEAERRYLTSLADEEEV